MCSGTCETKLQILNMTVVLRLLHYCFIAVVPTDLTSPDRSIDRVAVVILSELDGVVTALQDGRCVV